MIRCSLLVVALVAACASAREDKDPIKEKLFTAKVAYDKEMSVFRKTVGEWLDKREDAARKNGDKKALDQVKDDRKAFDEDAVLPKTALDLQQKQAAPRKALEAAYAVAIKDYVKAKKDDEAAATEKALLEFRKQVWAHVDSSKATFHDGYLRIPPNAELPTVNKHTGDVEIVVVARTEEENIRLRAQQKGLVIFNWEINPRELRILRPDGSLATAKVTPLKPNTWYTLKWRLTEEGMQISVDGKVIFEERYKNELTASVPVAIKAEKSAIDVKEFRVTPLAKPR